MSFNFAAISAPYVLRVIVALQGIIKLKNNLPVVAIFIEAFSLPYKYYWALLKIGLPLIITGVLLAVIDRILPVRDEGILSEPFIILVYIAFFLSLVMAIVGCHRIFILGDNIVAESSYFSWTGNEIKYVGWWIVLGVCTVLIAIPFFLVLMPFMLSSFESSYGKPIINFVVSVPVYYMLSRWSLVLPSSAIDVHGKNLSWSCGLSSGNGWRLTLLIGFVPSLLGIIFGFLPKFDSIVFDLFHDALWLVIGVVQIGLLSLSYKFLVNNDACDSTPDKDSNKAM